MTFPVSGVFPLVQLGELENILPTKRSTADDSEKRKSYQLEDVILAEALNIPDEAIGTITNMFPQKKPTDNCNVQ